LPSQAAVLTTCAEDVNCLLFNVTVATGASVSDTAYSRLALVVAGTGAQNFPPTNRIETNPFASTTDFWVTFRHTNVNNGTTADYNWLTLYDGSIPRLLIQGTGTNNLVKLSKRNAAGAVTFLTNATGNFCNTPAICKYDIHVVSAIAGSVTFYANGTPILTYTGDTTTDAATGLSKVGFAAPQTTNNQYYSEIIVANEDTRSMRLTTCPPLASGNAQQWTGTVGNVNLNTANDNNFNYTNTANQLSQWTTGCTLVTTAGVIADIQQFARLAKASGPQNFRWSLRDNGVNYDNGGDLPLTTVFQNYSFAWGPTSPATGLPWTISEINAGLQYGVQSRP